MKKTYFLLLLSLLILSFVLLLWKPIKIPTKPTYWKPKVGATFQWQLEDYPIDLAINTEIYDIDLFETPQTTIDKLHSQDKKVICYINVGAVEKYREDAKEFPEKVIGKEYEGWADEHWLDISNYKQFSSILEKRFDLAKEKECDGIEPDNIEGYQENTGFNLTYEDQLEFNIWLAEQAHKRNISIGLKNNPEQVADLVEYYDWALLEDCHEWNFCDEFKPFIDADKAVFQVEYTDNDIELGDFCASSNTNQFTGILKKRSLDSWIQSCTKI